MMKLVLIFLACCVAFTCAANAQQQQQKTQDWCEQSTGISTYFGKITIGSLITSSIAAKCQLPQFTSVPGQSSAGTLQFNLKGDYVYTAPQAAEVVDAIFVDVFCFNNMGVSAPLCRLTFVAQVAAPMTLAPADAPTTAQQGPPTVPTCPVVYHFTATVGGVLSASLKTAVGQPACPYGTWYELGRTANFGSVNLVASGDFSYTAPKQQTWDDFGYTLSCFSKVLCRGSAYVLVSGTAAPAVSTSTLAPSGGGGGGNNNGPVAGVTTVGQTCRDTCMLDTWKAMPDANPPIWDTTRNTVSGDDSSANNLRKNDGVAVGTVRASYSNGSLVLVIFGKVGNLGQRFPTFEPFEFRAGETLSARNVLDRVSRTSVAFNVDCLAKQPEYGMGEEVWHWTSVKNRTGELGPLHNSMGSWYQKFGGGHRQCDTFRADSCKYAPLLTPNAKQDPATGGVWSVDIDGCDVTWTGRFTLAAIRAMRKKSGAPVFTIEDGSTVRTTLYLEAVQPTSWLQPIMGYATDLIAKPLVLRLDPHVTVQLSESVKKLFAIDSSFRTFRVDSSNAQSDFGFALEMRLYPHVGEGATTSYQAEKHVSGFRWISQRWTDPHTTVSSGTELVCTTDPGAPTDSFFSAESGRSSCTNPVVALSKGPAMSRDACLANHMYVFDRPGLSAPQACATTFQNLTLRGTAPGTGSAPAFFGFEGDVELQLLLDTGVAVSFTASISRFVSMISVDGSGVTGRTRLCRATEYWPVLDPLGTSLPVRPFFLSEWASHAPEERDMCAAGTNTFGPTTWATVLLDIDRTEQVVIESLSMEFAAPNFAGDVIYFLNRDSVTGKRTSFLPRDQALGSDGKEQPQQGDSTPSPSGKKSVWWDEKYPFFNFRELSPLLRDFNTTGDMLQLPEGMEPQPIDYAVALTPGAIGVTTFATLIWSVRLLESDGSLGGHVTLRTRLLLDKLLSDRDVAGIHRQPRVTIAKDTGKTTYIAIFAMGGLIVGAIAIVVIFVSVDTSKPLPTWIPKMGDLRNAIMLGMGNSGSAGADPQQAQKARKANNEIDGINIVPMTAL